MTYLSREDRKNQIHGMFFRAAQSGLNPSFSMREIAKMIGMKPSGHLSKMLAELVYEDKLKKTKTLHRKATGKLEADIYAFKFYLPTPTPFERYLGVPAIRINGEIR